MGRREFLLLSFICLSGTLPAYGQSPLASELDSVLERFFALDLSPGMAVAAVRDGEVVYARGFGLADLDTGRPVSPDTLFYIASTTKSFTAFAAALLEHRGALDLDAPLSRYLPAASLHPPLSANEITVRDLLTHTHGISNSGPVVFRTAYTGVFTQAQLLELLGKHPPAPSGRTFDYGNLGYNLAGLAMEAAVGKSWKAILEDELFEPLGMTDTSASMSGVSRDRLAMPHRASEDGFRRVAYVKDDANMHPAGGHLSSVRDLARWIEAHLGGGRLDGRQVFPEAVVAETHRKQAEQDREFSTYHRHGWGLGWDLGTYDGELLVHRFGSFYGAFRSHVSFMPRKRIGVAVLVNEGTLGGHLADAVANAMYDRLLDEPDWAERTELALVRGRERAREVRKRIAADAAQRAARRMDLPYPLSSYAGVYDNPEFGRMEWKAVEGHLIVTMGLLRSDAEVYDADDNELRVELTGSGQIVRFSFEDGRAKSLTYLEQEFLRVDEKGSEGLLRSPRLSGSSRDLEREHRPTPGVMCDPRRRLAAICRLGHRGSSLRAPWLRSAGAR